MLMRGKIAVQLFEIMFSIRDPSSKRTNAPKELLESTTTAGEDHVFSVQAKIQTRARADKTQFRQQKANTRALALPDSCACAELEEQLRYPLDVP